MGMVRSRSSTRFSLPVVGVDAGDVVEADGEDVPVVGGAVDDGAWDVLVEGDSTTVVADDTGSESLSGGRRAPPMTMTTKETATTRPACFLVSTRSRPNGRTRLTSPNKNPANPTRISNPPMGYEFIGEAENLDIYDDPNVATLEIHSLVDADGSVFFFFGCRDS